MPTTSSGSSQPHAATVDTYATTSQVGSQLRPQSQPVPVSAGLAAPVLATLEAVWAGIRNRHPDVPEVVMVLAPGSIGAPRGTLQLGHFAAMRWHHRDDVMPEVVIGEDSLRVRRLPYRLTPRAPACRGHVMLDGEFEGRAETPLPSRLAARMCLWRVSYRPLSS